MLAKQSTPELSSQGCINMGCCYYYYGSARRVKIEYFIGIIIANNFRVLLHVPDTVLNTLNTLAVLIIARIV
jgi:hypothetical protein